MPPVRQHAHRSRPDQIPLRPSADLDWHPGSRHGAGRAQGRHRRCGIRSYSGHCSYRLAELPAGPEARDRCPPHGAGEGRPACTPGFVSGGSRGSWRSLPAQQPASPAHSRASGRRGDLRHLRRTASRNRVRRRSRLAERVLRLYSAAARLVGLPADGRAKHSAKYCQGHAAEALDGHRPCARERPGRPGMAAGCRSPRGPGVPRRPHLCLSPGRLAGPSGSGA